MAQDAGYRFRSAGLSGRKRPTTPTSSTSLLGLCLHRPKMSFGHARVLNNDFATDFRRWYPGFTHKLKQHPMINQSRVIPTVCPALLTNRDTAAT
jgi:hypothetical protein